MKRWLMAGCLTLLFTVTGCAVPLQVNVAANDSGASGQSRSQASAERMAATFALEDLQTGQHVTLNELLKNGHPVILNAFASWCGPCNQEAPELQALYQQYKGKVTFVGVDITDGDTLMGLKSFVHKHQVTYPVLLDHQDMFADAYGVVALPTTYVISPKGQIVLTHQGALTSAQAKTLFQSAAKLS